MPSRRGRELVVERGVAVVVAGVLIAQRRDVGTDAAGDGAVSLGVT